METLRPENPQEQEAVEYFNAIERDYTPYGLRQRPNEFFIVRGRKTIHIAKRYEVLIGPEGARRWVTIRDFIDRILAEEGIEIY